MRGTGLHASGLAQSGWAAPPHKSPRPLGRDGIFVLAPRRSKAAFTCHADSQQALLAHCNKQKHPPACRRFVCQNTRALAGGKPQDAINGETHCNPQGLPCIRPLRQQLDIISKVCTSVAMNFIPVKEGCSAVLSPRFAP